MGTLVVDIFEGKSKSLLWRGVAQDELSDKPDKNVKKLGKASDKIFKDFPPGIQQEVAWSAAGPMAPPLPPPTSVAAALQRPQATICAAAAMRAGSGRNAVTSRSASASSRSYEPSARLPASKASNSASIASSSGPVRRRSAIG